jgi:hypothetical protein
MDRGLFCGRVMRCWWGRYLPRGIFGAQISHSSSNLSNNGKVCSGSAGLPMRSPSGVAKAIPPWTRVSRDSVRTRRALEQAKVQAKAAAVPETAAAAHQRCVFGLDQDMDQHTVSGVAQLIAGDFADCDFPVGDWHAFFQRATAGGTQYQAQAGFLHVGSLAVGPGRRSGLLRTGAFHAGCTSRYWPVTRVSRLAVFIRPNSGLTTQNWLPVPVRSAQGLR